MKLQTQVGIPLEPITKIDDSIIKTEKPFSIDIFSGLISIVILIAEMIRISIFITVGAYINWVIELLIVIFFVYIVYRTLYNNQKLGIIEWLVFFIVTVYCVIQISMGFTNGAVWSSG